MAGYPNIYNQAMAPGGWVGDRGAGQSRSVGAGIMNFFKNMTPEMQSGLLQAGLGILANNTGHYGRAGPAIGAGGLLGVQGYQNAVKLKLLKEQQEAEKKYREGMLGVQQGELDLKKQLEENRKSAFATMPGAANTAAAIPAPQSPVAGIPGIVQSPQSYVPQPSEENPDFVGRSYPAAPHLTGDEQQFRKYVADSTPIPEGATPRERQLVEGYRALSNPAAAVAQAAPQPAESGGFIQDAKDKRRSYISGLRSKRDQYEAVRDHFAKIPGMRQEAELYQKLVDDIDGQIQDATSNPFGTITDIRTAVDEKGNPQFTQRRAVRGPDGLWEEQDVGVPGPKGITTKVSATASSSSSGEQDKAYMKKSGELEATSTDEMRKSALAASKNAAAMDRFIKNSDSAQGGLLQPVFSMAQNFFASFGFEPSGLKSVDDMQSALNSILESKMTEFGARGLTDQDMKILREELPKINTSKESRVNVAKVMQKLYDNEIREYDDRLRQEKELYPEKSQFIPSWLKAWRMRSVPQTAIDEGITQEDWDEMTPAEKKIFQ